MGRQEILFNPVTEEDDGAKRTANPYLFDLDQNGFPVFSDKNIRFVQTMIDHNSSYDIADETLIGKMYRDVLGGDEDAIKQAVYYTNKVNSTHLAVLGKRYSDAVKAGEIKNVDPETDIPQLEEKYQESSQKGNSSNSRKSEWVLTGGAALTAREIIKNKDELIEALKDDSNGGDEHGDAKAVYLIARYAENYLRDEGLTDFKKNNVSFASKFCHHTCIKGGLRDRYCIYDSVVGEVLPYYIWAYSDRTDIENMSYSKLKKLISDYVNDDSPSGYRKYRELYRSVCDGINLWRGEHSNEFSCESPSDSSLTIKPVEDSIGFQEVDRLIWYYFKGRRLDDAKKKMKKIVK